MASESSIKVRGGQYSLPFWSKQQLKKHSVAHKRRKIFNYTFFQKDFARGDYQKMHEPTFAKNSEKKNRAPKDMR